MKNLWDRLSLRFLGKAASTMSMILYVITKDDFHAFCAIFALLIVLDDKAGV